jgi:hypothetical protein
MLRTPLKSKQAGGLQLIAHSKAKKPANSRLRAFVFWLPDLDSDQGPAG